MGIVTQPHSPRNEGFFPMDEYILDVNREFMEYHGSIAVPIRYNLPEAELYQLLD